MKKKDKVGSKRTKFNNTTDNWSNDTKEQPHLTPGSCEYEEYVEDLKAHDPFRPDDEMHNELEDRNARLSLVLAEKAEKPADPTEKKKARMQAQKRAVQSMAKTKVIREAMKTPDIADDKLAKMITDDNPVLYDDGVTSDDYQDALCDFVVEK